MSKYSIDYLIERRKLRWEEDHNLDRDKILTELVAKEIINNKEYLCELKKYPEKLIELCFYIIDKDKHKVPFFFNEEQIEFLQILNNAKEDYIKGIRSDLTFLILKSRQLGFTSLITAYQLACTILTKNFEGYTLADVSDNAESIFQNKAKYLYNNMPDILKPTEKYNTKRQLIFEKINSSWAIDSATDNVGRSKTINFFHGSECAFWKSGIAKIQAGLGEALTKDAIKIYESTANGFNDYKTMWDSGAYINCFFEWWKAKEYQLLFPNEIVREQFIKDIYSKVDWIYIRLKWLKDEIKLNDNQIYWYYKKWEGYIDKNTIKQEYPCTPEEAFLSSGSCIFDTEKLNQQLKKVRNEKPIRIGYFNYIYDDNLPVENKISNIEWIDDPTGGIKIYEYPKTNYPYVIGGDPAGCGSDNFEGHVLDNTTGKLCAVLSQKSDEDLYSKQMYCLGMFYNEALIAIETNYSTYPVMELFRLGYTKQYLREKDGSINYKIQDKLGFNTTRASKPAILAELKVIVRESVELITDEETIMQMLRMIKTESGSQEADTGYHDDKVMSLAIAQKARTQQSYTVKEGKNDKEDNIPWELRTETKITDDIVGW